MEIKRLPAVAPSGRARAACPRLGVATWAVSEGVRGENPLSVAVFSVVWRRRSRLRAWIWQLQPNRCWQRNNSRIVSVAGRKTASGGVNVCVLYAVKRFNAQSLFLQEVLSSSCSAG